jgi:acetylornithine/LysW-gamma-L-lysine aminotransferase
VLVVKVGGGDVDLEAIAEDLSELDRPFVVLHGANRLRDRVAAALGSPPEVVESISGYSSVLTDDDAMDAMMAAYAGIRNKRLVEAFRRRGVDALGLTGLDGGLVSGVQNPGIRVKRDGRKLILRDRSGKAKQVNGSLLRSLIDGGYTPVLTVPIAGADGLALNSENDDVLSLIALELGATDVVSLIDEVGLLGDPADTDSRVNAVAPEELEEWEQRVSGRMRRKIRAIRRLFEDAPGGGPIYRIADGRVERPVSSALAGGGTVIRRTIVTEAGDGPTEAVEAVAAEPGLASWAERNAAHELDVYGKRGLTLVDAEGVRVRDEHGRTYIDCIAGNGSLALGHRHPALQSALTEQIDRIWHVPGAFVSPARARFQDRLHQSLPTELSRSFLSNSGTEAIEAALKISRVHTGRSGLVAAMRAFHGRTLGALSVTAERRYREPFEPLPFDVRRVRFNDEEGLREAVDASVAAVVLEPVQGEGGVHRADPDFLTAAREACDRSGALLVFDEVQTGFGRTGRLFAFEHFGVFPDVLCLAKSIAGGLPLGATVVRDGIELGAGLHGSTFGGNPLACAAASATLDVMDPALLARAEEIGSRICSPVVEAAPEVLREIRRVGAMIGIQLRLPARPYVQTLMEEGVLALTAGRTVLRLLPPLVMSDDDATRVGKTLARILSAH